MKTALLGLGSISLTRQLQATEEADSFLAQGVKTNHSACYWCYDSIPLEEFCEQAQQIGLKSVELTTVDQWPILKKYGLTCAMGTIPEFSLTEGWCNPIYHERLQKYYRKGILDAAKHGIENVIVMSGNRNRITDLDGMRYCAIGLAPMVKLAEEAGITLQMELLNSKVDHPDYLCDRTSWGAALCEMIGSPNFKLLYDIYHMQIMEGDIIATIRQYADYIGHYHTGGVPGRHEINDSQELNYPAIIRAIHETGFNGYVAQEFIPTYEDKIQALNEGLRICEI